MKNKLTGFGWLVIVTVVVTMLAALRVGHIHGWYWGVVVGLGGCGVICIGAACTPKRRAK